jgi:hypothetical protein
MHSQESAPGGRPELKNTPKLWGDSNAKRGIRESTFFRKAPPAGSTTALNQKLLAGDVNCKLRIW